MIFNQMTSTQQRWVGGAIAGSISLLVILLSQMPIFKVVTTACFATAFAVAMHEFYNIAYAKGLQPAAGLGIAAGVLYTCTVTLSTQYIALEFMPEAFLLATLIGFFLYYFFKGQSPFINLATTIFGLIYLAIPLSCMLRITYFFSLSNVQDGRWWIFYLIAVTKLTDTAAFVIGRQFGLQKLAPYISPKKTWEGAIGGLVAAVGVSALITLVATIMHADFSLTLWQSLWLGAGIGILGQYGDLAESLLKRDGGIKDSSQLPGLGGLLDIVDSLVFTSPLVYFFLKAYT